MVWIHEFFIPPICAEYIEEIKSGKEKFEFLASQYSDCSSAKNNGDLGLFGRGMTSYAAHSHSSFYSLYTWTIP